MVNFKNITLSKINQVKNFIVFDPIYINSRKNKTIVTEVRSVFS